jgi:PucR family transcriptional regulator, purine catabolism regulatory protein
LPHVLLSDLLALPILRQAEIRIIAGTPFDDRPIRWVHTGEVADIARYLTGGEVLLTAATGLSDASVERRRGYVRELVAAGAAAVIIELGRAFGEIPQEMIEEADAAGLVLAQLERDIPFVAVTQEVHTAILNEHHAALEQAAEIGDEFSQLMLDGAHVPAMLDRLAERLQNPVLLEDGSRRVVAFGYPGGAIGPILREWHQHSRRGHQGAAVGVQIAESEPRCAWSSVALRGEVWGRLHVLEVDTPVTSVTLMALGRAATNVALYLMAEREAHLNEEAERSLIVDVAHGVNFSGEDFLARATGLGVDFDGELLMIVMAPPLSDLTSRADGASTDDAQRIRETLRDARWPSLVGYVSNQIVAVVSADPKRDIAPLLEDLLGELGAGTNYQAGVSRPARASLLQRAYAEAQTAHQLGPATSSQRVHRYDSLVLYRLLTPLAKAGPHLANFVESELGELITYDEEHHSDLLSTLDAYLQNNGSKAATAGALFLQRRSVYYRLTRIEELLGRSIEPASHRVRLYLALRANEVLQATALRRI